MMNHKVLVTALVLVSSAAFGASVSEEIGSLSSTDKELAFPVKSAVYGLRFQGDQVGTVMILSNSDNLCDNIAKGNVEPSEARLTLATKITDSDGRFYPTTSIGQYEVTPPGDKLEQPSNQPLGESTSLFASMTVQKFDSACTDLAAHPGSDSSRGVFSLIKADIPLYSGDPTFTGDAIAAFSIEVGKSAETVSGTYVATYCRALSLNNGEVRPQTCLSR